MATKNEIVIDHLTAIVCVQENGAEKVIGKYLEDGSLYPFVFDDDSKIEEAVDEAFEISRETGVPIKILRFSNREDITENYLD